MKISTVTPKLEIALEIELTQKQKIRICEKAKQYILSSKYSHILYMFSKMSVMNTYKKEIKNTVGDKYFDKFLFVTAPSMTAKETNLKELNVSVYDEIKRLEDVFKAYKWGVNAQQ